RSAHLRQRGRRPSMKRKSPFHNSWRHSAHFDSRRMSKTTRSLVSDDDWSSGFIPSVNYLSYEKGAFAAAGRTALFRTCRWNKTRSGTLAPFVSSELILNGSRYRRRLAEGKPKYDRPKYERDDR